MIKSFSIRNLFKKEIKTICLSLGGFYIISGAFAVLMVKIQTIMLSNFETQPDDGFQNTLNVLHKIWIVYMPFMILIGICYLLFGLFYQKIKANKYEINLVLSILSLVWVIAYAISSIKYIDVFFASAVNDLGAFKYIGYVFAGFGLIAVLAVFTVPQYIIGKRIKKQGKLL